MSKNSDAIDALIEEFEKSGLRELHVRAEGVELYLSKNAAQAGLDDTRAVASASPPVVPASSAAAHRTEPPAVAHSNAEQQTWPADAVLIRAPYLGSFYRAPKPGAPAYVNVADRVSPDSELCMVEVMKLFTALRAGISAEVLAILAEDGQMVQADQLLFVLLPNR